MIQSDKNCLYIWYLRSYSQFKRKLIQKLNDLPGASQAIEAILFNASLAIAIESGDRHLQPTKCWHRSGLSLRFSYIII